MKWKKMLSNEVLQADDFYVSFLPNTRDFMGVRSRMFEGDDRGKGETALCKDGKYLILNGDYRKEYEEAFPRGYEACRAVFEANRHGNVSTWSSDTPLEDFLPGMFDRLTDDD